MQSSRSGRLIRVFKNVFPPSTICPDPRVSYGDDESVLSHVVIAPFFFMWQKTVVVVHETAGNRSKPARSDDGTFRSPDPICTGAMYRIEKDTVVLDPGQIGPKTPVRR
jgi:hypothetical protein